MSEMPDFEPTTPPVNEYPAPKKPRKKPTKRKAAGRNLLAPAPKRKVVKRRGRPAGVPNKPKVEQHAGGRYSAEVYDTIGRLMGMKASDRDAVLDIVKGLVK